MPSFGSDASNVLYLITCAAPPTREVIRSVTAIQQEGWDVCVVATPAALAWMDAGAACEVTGHAVRSEFRAPDEPEFEPRGDAVVVAPATFNTINKCATGVNDTLALGLMNEALGTEPIPMALVPWVNAALVNHPAYERNLSLLSAAGARVIRPDTNELEGFDRALRLATTWIATTRSRTRRS